jgi:1A family penicillin-binding protein
MIVHPHAERSARRTRVRRRVVGTLAALLVLGLAGVAWVWFAPCWLGGCAPLDDLEELQAEGSQLYDSDGEAFAVLATVNRRIVPLDSLPAHLPQAFLAVEDQRFYRHRGVDIQRVGGALLANIRRGGVAEGGSTITMQLARNLFPDYLPFHERSMRRKLMETRIARQLERTFTKDKILELYLNHIYLGSGAYGVEAASRIYFGKPAAELDLEEAALIAGLPASPSNLDPTRNPEGAVERRNLVLRRMAEHGSLSAEAASRAQEEPLRLSPSESADEGVDGSYFVERVRRELSDRVGRRFYTAGLRIHTTLDRTIQIAAEEELARQIEQIENGRFGSFNHPRYGATDEGVAAGGQTPYLQGAIVVIEAGTGEVRALVGGRDWNDSKFDRATQALRQPGSAFKPFVYLAALERFRSPVHQVDDSPLRMEIPGAGVWEPRNFGNSYDGMLTLREALTRSKNTATVRLAQEVGIGPAVRYAHDLGITSDLPEFPSTALGAAEVRPLELVASYAAFGNGGFRVEPHFVKRVEDRNGRLLWEATPQRRQAINPAAAFVLTTILRDVVDRGTGTAVRGAAFNGPAAGKTGTTNDNADVWFVGYTPDLVGGVWIGFDEPRTIIRGASGGTLAAPVWGRVMRRAYQHRPIPDPWSPPPGVVTEEVERGTGVLVDSDCPAQGPTYTEYFVSSPPRGLCPLDRLYAADERIRWGDEEWTGDPRPMEDLGIDWPELEEIRAARGEAGPAEEPRGDRREPQPREQPRPDGDRERGPAPEPDDGEPERPTVRESELPGTPVTPGQPLEPPPPPDEGDDGNGDDGDSAANRARGGAAAGVGR